MCPRWIFFFDSDQAQINSVVDVRNLRLEKLRPMPRRLHEPKARKVSFYA